MSQEAIDLDDVIVTVELALLFNPGKNKNTVVRRVFNNLKWRKCKKVQKALHIWSKSDQSYNIYVGAMTQLGLNDEINN